MLRTLAFAAVLGALALPAAAASVKVDVTGLDAVAAHAKIAKAAMAVCRLELRDASPLQQYYEHSTCIDDAIAGAKVETVSTPHTLARL